MTLPRARDRQCFLGTVTKLVNDYRTSCQTPRDSCGMVYICIPQLCTVTSFLWHYLHTYYCTRFTLPSLCYNNLKKKSPWTTTGRIKRLSKASNGFSEKKCTTISYPSSLDNRGWYKCYIKTRGIQQCSDGCSLFSLSSSIYQMPNSYTTRRLECCPLNQTRISLGFPVGDQTPTS